LLARHRRRQCLQSEHSLLMSSTVGLHILGSGGWRTRRRDLKFSGRDRIVEAPQDSFSSIRRKTASLKSSTFPSVGFHKGEKTEHLVAGKQVSRNKQCKVFRANLAGE
jgi:hypothetical protein